MNATDARTADDLIALVTAAAPATVAPSGLAGAVLAELGRSEARRRTRRRRRILAAAGALAVTGALAAAALQGRGDYFEWVQPSGAMLPTVGIGQTVVFSKDPQQVFRGDVVLLTYRNGHDGMSRVVGLPGDTVACPNNGKGRCDAVTVNGAALDERWLDGPTAPFEAATVGPGEVFVLGDARAAANDSRFVGTQPLSGIKGAAIGRQEEGKLIRLLGTPDRPVPDGGNIVNPADPVPPASAR